MYPVPEKVAHVLRKRMNFRSHFSPIWDFIMLKIDTAVDKTCWLILNCTC